MNPKSFLTGILEAGVIAFAFRTQGVGALEGSAGSVDGETVIVGDSDVFGAAAVLPAVLHQSRPYCKRQSWRPVNSELCQIADGYVFPVRRTIC